uniref:Exocyst subunit Exo70 family protein n=1 Tax=Arundo donax TaxID=35708 RepID=A0A0A9C1M3_ARUDO
MQLKQNHPACDVFTHEDLFEPAKKPLSRLFTVASVVCAHKVRKSPEKLFCVLNMCTALMDATPTLRKVLYSTSISTDVGGLLAELKETARGIIKELKGLIQTYSSQKVVQNEGITSLTGYLMRYIRLLVKHKSSLDTVLGHDHTDTVSIVEELKSTGHHGLLTVEGMNSTGSLVFELIADLDSVLEKQSKLFSSKDLQCIFLMNNMHFILQEVDQSDIRLIVGSRWIRKCQNRINAYMNDYLSASWGPVRSNLETAKSISPSKRLRTNILNFLSASPPPLQNFIWSFSGTCDVQMCWRVPSPVLRDVLREKILEFVAPAYHAHLESLKRSVRGTAEDFELELKSKISELFEG